MTGMPPVELVRWREEDFDHLRAILGDPAMTEHLGGPQSDEMLRERHERYLNSQDGVFNLVEVPSGASVGWVGYWEREWKGVQVWEMGWSVLVAFQGRGYARAGAQLAIDRMREDGRLAAVHAFPAPDNPPSNALCRTLGFELVGEDEVEFPKGSLVRVNDWRLRLQR